MIRGLFNLLKPAPLANVVLTDARKMPGNMHTRRRVG